MLPCSDLLSLTDDIVLIVSVVGKVIHTNSLINKANLAIFVMPIVRLLVVEIVVPYATNTVCGV